jgi:hypothetical protein
MRYVVLFSTRRRRLLPARVENKRSAPDSIKIKRADHPITTNTNDSWIFGAHTSKSRIEVQKITQKSVKYNNEEGDNPKKRKSVDSDTDATPIKKHKQSTLEGFRPQTLSGCNNNNNASQEEAENIQSTTDRVQPPETAVTDSPGEKDDFNIDEMIEDNDTTTLMLLPNHVKGTAPTLAILTKEGRKIPGFEMIWSNAAESRFYLKFQTENDKNRAEMLLRQNAVEASAEIPEAFQVFDTKRYTEAETATKLLVHTGTTEMTFAKIKEALDNWLKSAGFEQETTHTWVEPNPKKTVWYLVGLSHGTYNLLIKEMNLEIQGQNYGVTASLAGRYRLDGFDNRLLPPNATHARKILAKMGITPSGDIYINRQKDTGAPRHFVFFNIDTPPEYHGNDEQFRNSIEVLEAKFPSEKHNKIFVFKVKKVVKKRGQKQKPKPKTYDEWGQLPQYAKTNRKSLSPSDGKNLTHPNGEKLREESNSEIEDSVNEQ